MEQLEFKKREYSCELGLTRITNFSHPCLSLFMFSAKQKFVKYVYMPFKLKSYFLKTYFRRPWGLRKVVLEMIVSYGTPS